MKKKFFAVWDFVFHGQTFVDDEGYTNTKIRGPGGKLRRFRSKILNPEEQRAHVERLVTAR